MAVPLGRPFFNMAGLPVPNDHNLTTDPYTHFVVTVPDSPYWRAIFRGQLFGLSTEQWWDSQTGDVAQAAAAGWGIFDSVSQVIDGGGA